MHLCGDWLGWGVSLSHGAEFIGRRDGSWNNGPVRPTEPGRLSPDTGRSQRCASVLAHLWGTCAAFPWGRLGRVTKHNDGMRPHSGQVIWKGLEPELLTRLCLRRSMTQQREHRLQTETGLHLSPSLQRPCVFS